MPAVSRPTRYPSAQSPFRGDVQIGYRPHGTPGLVPEAVAVAGFLGSESTIRSRNERHGYKAEVGKPRRISAACPLVSSKSCSTGLLIEVVLQGYFFRMSSFSFVAGPSSDVAERQIPSPISDTGPCQACYDERRKCIPSGSPEGQCRRCLVSGFACKRRKKKPPTPQTVNVVEEDEDEESLIDSLLRGSPSSKKRYSPISRVRINRKLSGTSTELTSSHDDGIRAARRGSKHIGRRTPLAAGARSTIDAIQIAISAPLVTDGLMEPSELVELYHLYMVRWNPCVLVLDPNIHTLQHLAGSKLLLTVVAMVAAQDYPDRPEYYPTLVRYSRQTAAGELLSEAHSIETIQAFLLLSLFPDWNLPLDRNRSWLDLGLALDLAQQMSMDKSAARYDYKAASPSERNVFRTWMICHNLSVVSTLIFDKPLFCSDSFSSQHYLCPGNTGDGSLESVVGTLTTPLEQIDFHLRQQSLHRLMYGDHLVPAIKSGEHASSPLILDLRAIDTMAGSIQRVETLLSTGASIGSQCFWLHLARITTEYSRLLLLSKYTSMDATIRDSDLRSRMLNSATLILQSYIDIFESFECAKYAPGCFLAYGVLAAGVTCRLSGNENASRTTLLINRLSIALQQSPAVAGDGIRHGLLVRLIEGCRAGGSSEPDPSAGSSVSMSMSGFPSWWRLYF